MKVVRTRRELHAELGQAARPIGFVPTMGALHDGHASLVRTAKTDTATTVVSIFVNPTQFGPLEDLAAYPRDETGDLALLEELDVEVVYLPAIEDVYPAGAATTVSVFGPLAETLEGAARPGHFDGVASVVAILLNLVRPQVAYFGQKDAQQVAVVKRMAIDLALPVEIRVCPTVRDDGGLALSSRNAYLSPADRAAALSLYRALTAGKTELRGSGDSARAEACMKAILDAADGVEPEYAVVVDAETFGPPHAGRATLLAVAARVGRARLIDNILFDPSATRK
ncbi:MAG TPA: pantoate--beta-alanine ligase [Actinomycetota bacterium]|nr:pantoate--beta-alanine ligase [Actinomycetota bacterium]